MGYINIYVSNDAKVYIKNSQLFLENSESKVDFPLEDINSVMIENLNTVISTYTLSKLAENGILTFICNQNHLPNGIVLPYMEHYQTLQHFDLQLNLTKPVQKQLWQKIVKNKICNQNEVLNTCGQIDPLKELEKKVLSGDTTNVEAQASLKYFKLLFGERFKRREENQINAFLNYGYSIVRGFVARSLVCHGLMPFYGINHSNQFNQFNLADDLIEPFRPVVDLFVKVYLTNETELTPKIKSQIFDLINYDVEVAGQKQTLANSIDMFVESFVRSLKENKVMLYEINIIRLERHKYE